MITGTLTEKDYKKISKAAKTAAKVFRQKGWTYRGYSSEPFVPEAFDLEERVYGLLHSLLENEEVDYVSSGRLRVARSGEGEIDIMLELGALWEEESDD